jgi:nicotinamide mononucleotide transporter
LINDFVNWIIENYIEIIGVITGIAGVWLTTRQIIWCWPVGLINVLLYIYIFFVAKLYADFGLQIFYLVMTLYGWYNWKYGGKNHKELKVSRAGIKNIILYLIIGTVSFIAIGFILKKFTDAAYPYWDSLVSVWGIIGTYMQAKKQIENWIVWIIVDMNCVGIYICKDLLPTVALYFIFVLLAVIGFYKWKKDLKITVVS